MLAVTALAQWTPPYMARLSPSRETLNTLFAKSGNRCAFPGCTHELVSERNVFVGQICHIEAANPGGQRFNSSSTDERRRSFENLLLLCYKHHKETDDVVRYSVDALSEMKGRHESNFGEKPFKVNEAFLYRLEAETQSYWESVAVANETGHLVPQLAVNVNVGIPATHLFGELGRSVERLSELLNGFAQSDFSLNGEIREHLVSLGYDLTAFDAVPYYKSPFVNRNWESHALAVNNAFADLLVALKQTEVRFLEEYVKTHPNEADALSSLVDARREFLRVAASAAYVD